jgi:hypothetical protein
MLRLVCPHCEKTIGVPQATVNAVVACPACGQRFRIPNPSIAAEPEPEPEPAPVTAPSPSPAAHWTPPPTSPYDDVRDAPRGRRRRRRFRGSLRSAELAATGKSLVILFACLLGCIELADLIITVTHHVDADEMLGDELEELTPEEQKAMREDAKKIDYKAVAKSVGSTIFIGALVAGLCAGKNGARIALAVILFLRTAGQLCCGMLAIGILSAVGVKLGAFMPELILLGLVIAIYPTVAVTLLVSNSIKAYCDG